MNLFNIEYCKPLFYFTMKYCKELIQNSPFSFQSCAIWFGRTCLKVVGVGVAGLGVVPIDWTCKEAGVKPLFMGFYYPGMKRLAGEVNETLGSRPSKDLSYINENTRIIRKLQEYTAYIEDGLAVEFENKIKNNDKQKNL